MYSMTVYSGKEKKCAFPLMAATNTILTRLTARTENLGHKLYMDNSSSELFDDFSTKTKTAAELLDQTEK